MENTEKILQRIKTQFLHYKDMRKVLASLERKVPSENIADVLLLFLSDEDEKVRDAAINAVEIAYSYGNIKYLEKKLINGLTSSDLNLKKSILKVFAYTDTGPAEEIAFLLRDNDQEVKILAARALGELKDPSVLSDLAVHISTNNNKVKEEIKNTLYSISWSTEKNCLDEFLKLLAYPHKNILEIVIECIKNIQDEEKIQKITCLLQHKDPRMRIGAAAILANIARYRTKEVIIEAFLAEKDGKVKEELGKILESIGSTAAVTFLQDHHKDQNLSIEEIYAESLQSIFLLPDMNTKLDYLNKIAHQHISMGQHIKAHALFDDIYNLIVIHERNENRAPGLIALIQLFSEIMPDLKRQKVFDEALQAAENTGNKLRAAEYCTILGNNALKSGDCSAALTMFHQARKFSHQKKNTLLNEQVILWTKIADGLIRLGEEEQGLELFERAKDEVLRSFFEDQYNFADYLKTIGAIAIGYANAGQLGEAISLADRINEPEYDGLLHADLGIIAHNSGDDKKTVHLFNKSIKIAKKMYQKSATARAYIAIAEHYIEIENKKKSEELLHRVIFCITHEFDKGEDRLKPVLLGKTAEVYLKLNNTAHALSIAHTITDATIKTRLLIDIARRLKDDNKYKDTREILDMCKKTVVCILRSREQAPLLIKLGILYNNQGDHEMTTRLVQRAYQLAKFNENKDIILADCAPLMVGLIR